MHVTGRLGISESVARRLQNAGCAKDRHTRWRIITVWGGDVGIAPGRTLPIALGSLWGEAGVRLAALLRVPTVGGCRR